MTPIKPLSDLPARKLDWKEYILPAIFLPSLIIATYTNKTHMDPLWVFLFSSAAIIPLAKWMGDETETIAEYTGPVIGGFLNATFGNATELIIALLALKAGLIDVVKYSLAGSIMSNLLLVLGFSMFLGGIRFRNQTFQANIAKANAATLTLSVIALLLPTAFAFTSDNAVHLENISVGIAALLILGYVLSVRFESRRSKVEEDQQHSSIVTRNEAIFAGVKLGIITLLVAAMSEQLVSSIEVATEHLHLSAVFTGIILLPIIGNAAEHATSVTVAMKNKMDLSIAVAIGSSKQVALLLVPVCILASRLLGHPMDLNFGLLPTLAIAFSVVITNTVTTDGESNWLEGILLLITYAIIGILFFF